MGRRRKHKLHRVRLVIDGKPAVSWRCCTGCTAVKTVAMLGKAEAGARLAPVFPVHPRRGAK